MIFVSGCAKEKNILKSIENLNDEQLDQGIYYEYKYSDEEIKGIKNESISNSRSTPRY